MHGPDERENAGNVRRRHGSSVVRGPSCTGTTVPVEPAWLTRIAPSVSETETAGIQLPGSRYASKLPLTLL